MSKFFGNCHCGAVEIVIADPPVEVSECNCSLCRRLGTLWHYCTNDRAQLAGEVVGYVQGDCSLTTWRCPICGCITHWTAIDPEYNRMGVNLRMFDPELWNRLPRRLIDGASF